MPTLLAEEVLLRLKWGFCARTQCRALMSLVSWSSKCRSRDLGSIPQLRSLMFSLRNEGSWDRKKSGEVKLKKKTPKNKRKHQKPTKKIQQKTNKQKTNKQKTNKQKKNKNHATKKKPPNEKTMEKNKLMLFEKIIVIIWTQAENSNFKIP
ncbi:kelch-like protein 29 isoform x1 [Limosa lapponica baueri]|uniref:Kelch-like protein 29 isoform x1 n=1 Tax=Limosa lapponica baueri TaxID=1758121 RepID=A0A2I0TY59_LIMLA|nr:kelch-like protein 29 isoform x1 [Limosa lapponica baueri]